MTRPLLTWMQEWVIQHFTLEVSCNAVGLRSGIHYAPYLEEHMEVSANKNLQIKDHSRLFGHLPSGSKASTNQRLQETFHFIPFNF